jgi:hypothetical protein
LRPRRTKIRIVSISPLRGLAGLNLNSATFILEVSRRKSWNVQHFSF